ncbi:hypothetical protein CPHO_12425 (plasmid) [Corynebacterium phocae]|uniref:Uncharacterized protein n=2 Tax=Corynebacterium phocae TaxID=161895 RepID=A0A1L7D6U6_9CORY|nr:hypothetical protein CPHO_12425 [Corynebacterium phocae]
MMIWGVLAVIIGIPLIIVAWKNRNSATKSRVFLGVLLAVLAGFVSFTVWLSWNSRAGIADVILRYGMPYPAIWQVVACGLTVIILSGLVIYKLADSWAWVPMVSFFTAMGLAIAYTAGVSYGPPSQEGIGVMLSFIGVGMLTTLTNLVFVAIALKKRSSLK